MTVRQFEDLSEKQRNAKLRRLERIIADQHTADIKWLMSDSRGRRLMYWLIYGVGNLNGGGYPHNVKCGVAAGQHHAYTDGTREIAKRLNNEIERLEPQQMLLMIQEQIDERREELAMQIQSVKTGESS